MRAIVPRAPGGPEVLTVEQRPIPAPAEGQVLIRTAFAGINRHDCTQRKRGTPPKGATDILGLEVAGTVEAVGDGVPRHWIGAEVCALVNGGGYADFTIADIDLTFPRPPSLGLNEAAALPEGLFTTWLNLIKIAGADKARWVLIHGGTSGVGSLAIQIMHLLNVRVISTSGTDEKCAVCRELGADVAVNYNTADFVAEVMRATDSQGVGTILDMAGARYAEKNLQSLAKDGYVVHLSSSGTPLYSAPFQLITQKRARITGSQMRGLESAHKRTIADDLRLRVWPELGKTIKPLIDSIFPLGDVAAAHARMESGVHAGKILLDLS